jgi:hypothetical protein
MASLKQFLLSIFATTVSIALTFGTAAIIDYKKKQSEKREIVMMVMYDMYNSLKSVEKADSMIRHTMEVQRQIAEDTSQFNKLKFQLVFLVPRVDYTEATERIFSSSIETINTVGNVLFTENVAKFYQMRQFYKTAICYSIANELERNNPFTTIRGTVNYAYSINALLSYNILKDLRHLYALCKQIMEVTDEEIDVYQKEREQIEKGLHEEDVVSDSIMNEIMELQRNIDELNVKIK